MIIIWGRTTRKFLRPDSAAVLGPRTRCPMRNCGGGCRLYNVTRYCHLYWIPLCPEGEPREIVQCMRCRAMFELREYQDFQVAAARNVADRLVADAVQTIVKQAGENSIVELLRADRFAEAETKARAMLKKDPMNINMMCHLNVALNGLGKYKEASGLADQIVFHWVNHCRAKWIAKGRPKELSAFPRLMMNQATPTYRLEAKQYFEPEKIDDHSEALFKVLAHPRAPQPSQGSDSLAPNDKKLFKFLRIRGGKCFLLAEISATGTTTEVVSYTDGKQPGIRKVALDVAAFLGAQSSNDGVVVMPVAQAEVIPEAAMGKEIAAMAEMTPLTAVEPSGIPEVV